MHQHIALNLMIKLLDVVYVNQAAFLMNQVIVKNVLLIVQNVMREVPAKNASQILLGNLV